MIGRSVGLIEELHDIVYLSPGQILSCSYREFQICIQHLPRLLLQLCYNILSTVLDDYSRYIVAWRLCASMTVTDTLNDALAFSGLNEVRVKHKPRLLSDNGLSYIAGELKRYLSDQGMTHTRGRPYHPMTQGKIERWHRSMKNQVLLENYYLPGDLECSINRFVEYYNHERYHESLKNLTPADVFTGTGQQILDTRSKIKIETLALRKEMHYRRQLLDNQMSWALS